MRIKALKEEAENWAAGLARFYGRPPASIKEVERGILAFAPEARALTDTDFVSAVREKWALVEWAKAQKPTFHLTGGLAAKLLLTDCSKVSPDEVRWPFDAFVVCLPDPSPLWMVAADMPVPARTIVFARGLETRTGPAFWTQIQNDGPLSVFRTADEVESTGDVEVFLRKFTSADEAKQLGVGATFTDLDATCIQGALRILVNLSLYLASLRASGEWDPAYPSMGVGAKQRKTRQPVTDRQWVLGQKTKLSPELRAAARNDTRSAARWELEARYLVRGHWRQQAHGPGRQLRRRQWIEPFWKGPPAGTRFERDYEVE